MTPEIVEMEIVKGLPPNFDHIAAVFENATKPGVLFCWGNTIYNPSNVAVPDYLIAHENVHRKQQNGEPWFWWDKYLVDEEFRLAQEIPAHRKEYQQFCLMYPERNQRRVALRMIAERLSGPLYNHMISFEKAKAIIKAKDDE